MTAIKTGQKRVTVLGHSPQDLLRNYNLRDSALIFSEVHVLRAYE